jgi:hypothetical protein
LEALQAALEGPPVWNRPRSTADADSALGTDTAQGTDTAAGTDAAADAGGTGVADTDATGGVADTDGTDAAADTDGTRIGTADIAAANGPAGSTTDDQDQEAVLEAYLAGRGPEVPTGVVAGRVAECLPAGPGLAGWLATAGAEELEDGALAGVAASFRRLASWAEAGELATVAQIACREAARDQKIGVEQDGRPTRIPVSACAEVSLGLVMSQHGAAWWTDLAVTLRWRLAATGLALREGLIDLSRARLIAELTAVLDDQAARAVEAKVLPRAGDQTTGQLRAVLRRAVIAADPRAAERRRQEAERRAKVSLYGDENGTATLSGSGLPAIHAAAAMARITAMARPPPSLHKHVTARDLTCRSPTCRQPAWRADLDHTVPGRRDRRAAAISAESAASTTS